jgi:hypothetical protein
MLCVVSSVSARGEGGYRVLAYSGQEAPQTAGQAYEYFPTLPAVNNSGRVIFGARLRSAVPGDAQYGLFVTRGDEVRLLARTGDPAPQMAAGLTLSELYPQMVSEDGTVVFSSAVDGPGIPKYTQSGTWVVSPGATTPQLVVGTGQPAPGMPGGTVLHPLNLRVASGGNAIVTSVYEGAPPGMGSSGIWAGQPGNLSLVARQGMAAPGVANAVFGRMDYMETWVNSAGTISFTAPMEDAHDPQTQMGMGLWSGPASSPVLMFATDQRAPDVVEERQISYVSSSRMAASGKMMVMANLQAAGEDGRTGAVVYTAQAGVPGSARAIARSGEQVPGFAAGVTFRGASGPTYSVEPFVSPQINSSGQVAFMASVGYPDAPPPPDNAAGAAPPLPAFDQTEDETIWLYTPGKGLKLLAREKDPAPGAPAGYEFRAYVPQSVGHDPSFQGLSVNGKGQVAFVASFAEEVEGPFQHGIWATDESGNLNMVVAPGQEFDVGDGEMRKLDSFYFLGGTSSEDAQAFEFNDRGELTFIGNFADGTQAVVVVQTPEPAGTFVGWACVASLLLKRRGDLRRH